jgi:hypothetical protein
MLNELFPYDDKVRKFKFLKATTWHGIEYFEGQIVEVNKSHPLFNGIIVLAKD